jgi:hypothetical protein
MTPSERVEPREPSDPLPPAPGNGQRDTFNQEENDNGLHAWR